MGGAGGAGISQAASSLLDYFSNQEAQDFHNQTREGSERFQERMSSTQWQRGVTDMKAAGLNPMLAYSQGGASSPSGSSGAGPSGANLGESWNRGASTSSQVAVNNAQIENIKAQTSKTEAERDMVIAQTPTFAANIRNTTASAAHTEQLIKFLTSVNPYRIDMENSDMRIRRFEEGEHKARFPHRDKRAEQEVGQSSANIRHVLAQAILSELDEPGARARAASNETGYGQYVRPYLDDASKVAGSAAAAFFGGKVAGALKRMPLPFEKGAGPRKGVRERQAERASEDMERKYAPAGQGVRRYLRNGGGDY